MTIKFIKDPDAVLDYTVDWSDWLVNDTIISATWVVPTGITKDSSSNTDTTATIWLSGGTVNIDYSIVCRITTLVGRIEDRTFIIKCKER